VTVGRGTLPRHACRPALLPRRDRALGHGETLRGDAARRLHWSAREDPPPPSAPVGASPTTEARRRRAR
jgi:hypothetical protein